MSEESKPEAAEHQQELKESALPPEESGAESSHRAGGSDQSLCRLGSLLGKRSSWRRR